ncbi:MAG TPA: LacI family DNA-binding transcriptional regulator [Mycobacteriales bacterium]|nr:LacI family DNA-binding transcriptional regulator [Mycobacteriales bacterium]
MRVPTLRDVAELAGVHPATASRALNAATRNLVNGDTAARVARAAAKLGYTPNPIARSLKTSRSGSVGVVIPDLTNPLFPPIVRGIDDVLSAGGFNALIVNTDNDSAREDLQVASLRARQVEGLIIGTARLDDPLLHRLVRDACPVVLINRRVDTPSLPSVTGDDATGVDLALRHLAGLGHRRIAHLAGPQWTSTGQVRLRAYRQGVAELGLVDSPDLVVVCEQWTESEGAAGLTRLLARDTGCTAVLAGNDLVALGCYDVMRERNIACPETLSIVGFNDMPIVDKLRPSLTTVHVPHYQVGAEAARLLLERIADAAAPVKSVLLPLRLVVRDSTAAPPPVG